MTELYHQHCRLILERLDFQWIPVRTQLGPIGLRHETHHKYFLVLFILYI